MFGLISLISILLIALLGFVAHRLTKRRMKNALGREVSDYEVNSINSWMKVQENENKHRRQI